VVTKYLLLALIVFAINLLPAFGPPTWTVVVYTHLRWSLNAVAVVVIAALCAAAGRYLLAHGSRLVSEQVSQSYRDGLASIEQRLVGSGKGTIALTVLFVLSPLPSAQLFVAAGLLKMRLARLTGLFLVGRLVTYSLYLAGSISVDAALGGVLTKVWGAPWAIALQLFFLGLIALEPYLISARAKSK
jgi:membrane protein YqaA with SNARE-associated domain